MCGIAGFTGNKDQALLQGMTQAIAYRGPDSDGYFSNGSVNFGHRRLSILDVAGGLQPMFDAKKDISIIFNGEIYNYRELKRDYLNKYSFTTTSDTEVLIYLYLEKGEEFLSYLNGMFALALWDNRSKKLILARDRMGQKPLYYTHNGGELYFASEPKSLLINPSFKRQTNLEAVSLFFNFQFFPGSLTPFQGINKLLPGHYLVWQNGKSEIKNYWQLKFNDSSQVDFNKLEDLVKEAVKIRLIADVPLGVFLSGGIDSTTVAYFAAKNSPARIKTFSIGFDQKSFDETRYAQLAAKFLGSDHYHHQFSKQDLLELVPKIFDLQDEPMADASILPTFLLSRFTRQHVTVALGGDGADELFAGYPTFQAHYFADSYGKLPSLVKYLPERLINSLPVSFDNFSLEFKLKQFIKGVNAQGYQRDIDWFALFNTDQQTKLFNQDFHNYLKKLNDPQALKEFFESSVKNSKSNILSFWQRGYLVDDILQKVDRASMYNALEARSPFLDFRLVSYVNNLPYEVKMKHWQTKSLLKQLMKDKLPTEIINRRKKGFGVPLAEWFCTDLKDFLQESLSRENIEAVGFFNYEFIQELIDNHLARKQNNRSQLWSLLSFIHWHKKYL